MHYRRKNQQNGFTKGVPACVERFSLCCGIPTRTNSGYDCFHGLEQTYKFARRARDYARIYRGEYSVSSIIDIERIWKKKKSHRGALDQATSFISQEVEETSRQFDEAEAATKRSLEAQQHTDTTTTTWVSLLVVLISHILHIIDATSPVFRPVFFFNRMKKLHNCEFRHFQASLRQLKNSQIARNFARRTRTKVTVIWAKYNDEYSSFHTLCASNIAQLGLIIVFEKFWNFLVKPTS